MTCSSETWRGHANPAMSWKNLKILCRNLSAWCWHPCIFKTMQWVLKRFSAACLHAVIYSDDFHVKNKQEAHFLDFIFTVLLWEVHCTSFCKRSCKTWVKKEIMIHACYTWNRWTKSEVMKQVFLWMYRMSAHLMQPSQHQENSANNAEVHRETENPT